MTQAQALEIMKTGANIFLTGPAGSGKTHVLNQYLHELRRRNIPVGVTASTGIAATHMGGITIHSWCGMGVNDFLSEQDIEEIGSKDHVKKKVESAKVLIIDEISMLHDYRLDFVDRIARFVRKNESPFGGLQVILCGDFFQLPPINRVTNAYYNELFDQETRTNFAYHSQSWKDAGFVVCYLGEQHRQNDSRYIQILNEIRNNCVSERTWQILRERIGATPQTDKIVEPTKLYSHNISVDAENERELAKLSGNVFTYGMASYGNKKLVEGLKKSCLAPENLKLKKNARVMFVKNNYEKGYVNGTLGTVLECDQNQIVVRTAGGLEITVEPMEWTVEEESRVLAEISQYPLRLAWAITIHKSQGMSLDAALVDLSQSFEKGMGYVALSRLRSLQGLSLLGLNERALCVHEEAWQKDMEFRRVSDEQCEAFDTEDKNKIREMQLNFLGPEPANNSYQNGKRIRNKVPKLPRMPTEQITKQLIDSGKSIKQVANERHMVFGTILNHIEKIKKEDPKWDISHLREAVPSTKFQRIWQAFGRVGMQEGGLRPLSPVMSVLKSSKSGTYSFEELRIVRLFL